MYHFLLIVICSTFVVLTSAFGQTHQIGASFNARTVISSEVDVLSLDTVDLDADGDLDILTGQVFTSEMNEKTISWYENDGELNFTEHVIDTNATFARIVIPVDMDNDGDIDIVASTSKGVLWLENEGNQNFSEHSIYEGQTESFFFIDVVDVDNDEDIDVISSHGSLGALVWFENDGSQNYLEHSIDGTSKNSVVHRSVIGDDFDQDGDTDIISVSSDNGVIWFENDGRQNYTLQLLPAADSTVSSIYVIDLDQDNDKDIVVGQDSPIGSGIRNSGIIWYENNGSQNFIKKIIYHVYDGAISMNAKDMDNDGDIDVAVSFLNETSWFENDGFQVFSKHLLNAINPALQTLVLTITDIDNNGNIDFLTGLRKSRISSINELGRIDLYKNTSSQSRYNVITSEISNSFRPKTINFELHEMIDIDQDGDQDLISSFDSATSQIVWLENDGSQFLLHN